MRLDERLKLKLLNAFVEPTLLPECAIRKEACPLALTPPEHLRTLDKMMKRMAAAFRELKIDYVACAGTVLGSVRHHGFIPWDDDADYYITRVGLAQLRRRDVRKLLLEKYKLKVVTMYAVLGTLKLVLPGHTMANSPFIDLFSTRELFDARENRRYLMNELGVVLALSILNPGSDYGPEKDRLYEGVDYRHRRDGSIKFLTVRSPWYSRKIPIPKSGDVYLKRMFGENCLTHAVLRIYVPVANKSHKFRDIVGVYQLPPALLPKFSNGKVVKPGAAGELRTKEEVERQPKNPRYFSYYGQERSIILKA